MRTKRIVAMNGGGTESAALLPWVVERGFDVTSVFVHASYPAAERHCKAAEALAHHFDVPHREVDVDYGLDTTHLWPDGTPGPQVAWTALLFSIGSGIAVALGAEEVYLGQTFPAPKLKKGWDLIFETTDTVTWRPELQFPLSGVKKEALLLPPEVWELTDSCYTDPVCGTCAKCRGREAARA